MEGETLGSVWLGWGGKSQRSLPLNEPVVYSIMYEVHTPKIINPLQVKASDGGEAVYLHVCKR